MACWRGGTVRSWPPPSSRRLCGVDVGAVESVLGQPVRRGWPRFLTSAPLGLAPLELLVRQVGTPDSVAYALTHMVGFVRRLSHQLVDAFRSALEEVVQADLAPHVMDASSPEAAQHIATVRGVLRDTGAEQVPELLALNKAGVAGPGHLAVRRAPECARRVRTHGRGTERPPHHPGGTPEVALPVPRPRRPVTRYP